MPCLFTAVSLFISIFLIYVEAWSRVLLALLVLLVLPAMLALLALPTRLALLALFVVLVLLTGAETQQIGSNQPEFIK